MMPQSSPRAAIAIACGGTGGHLFPGLAVARQLLERACAVTLLVSPKEIDQQAIGQGKGMRVVTLPAVGLTRGRALAFGRGFLQSYLLSKRVFRPAPPQAVLAMGGFTSAPPLLAAKRSGALSFLHESNTIPGRANRWLSWVVDQAFVGFPESERRLHCSNVMVTGTPVRPQFQPRDPGACRHALGLDPARPTILVMGGSQGASGINQLVLQSLPALARSAADWQWLHLAGATEVSIVRTAYSRLNLRVVVHAFFAEMEIALGAATVALSRAGASSLAELAAMGVPSILVPYPGATDAHQLYNALAWQQTGAACLLQQKGASAAALSSILSDLVQNVGARETMQRSLAQWHYPRAAEQIADIILKSLAIRNQLPAGSRAPGNSAASPNEPDAPARSTLPKRSAGTGPISACLHSLAFTAPGRRRRA
jgi:UDP-N-acetylglucosamine--N-acetylmuramyl-(pentapeptide) pyrophosphoryl-undecaprenol N-acetylglucosamine transferase